MASDTSPQSKHKIQHAKTMVQRMHAASSSQQLQSQWHLQQWWILIAGLLLFSSVLVFALHDQSARAKLRPNI